MDWGAARGWLSVGTGASGRTMVIGGVGWIAASQADQQRAEERGFSSFVSDS
jgi:hypothetical protein